MIGWPFIGDPRVSQSLAIHCQLLPTLGTLLLIVPHEPVEFAFVQNVLEHPTNGVVVRHPAPFQFQVSDQCFRMVPGPIGYLDRGILPTQFGQKDEYQQGRQLITLATCLAPVSNSLKIGIQTGYIVGNTVFVDLRPGLKRALACCLPTRPASEPAGKIREVVPLLVIFSAPTWLATAQYFLTIAL